MKKIYNSPVATVFNALPVSMMALSTDENNNLSSGDIGTGDNQYTINSRDNEGTSNSGNVWDEQW